jgi:hypothetical protein
MQSHRRWGGGIREGTGEDTGEGTGEGTEEGGVGQFRETEKEEGPLFQPRHSLLSPTVLLLLALEVPVVSKTCISSRPMVVLLSVPRKY